MFKNLQEHSNALKTGSTCFGLDYNRSPPSLSGLISPPLATHIPHCSNTLGQGGGANSLNPSRLYSPDFARTGPFAQNVLPSLFCYQAQCQHLLFCASLSTPPTLPTSPFQNESLPPCAMPLLDLDQGPSIRF